MQFKIQVIVDDIHGQTITEELLTLDKSSDRDGLVGLSLSGSKRALKQLQKVIVNQQVGRYTQAHRCCPSCHKKRRIMGSYDIQYRTLFGIVPVPNLRLYHCQCNEHATKTFSVLNGWLAEHNSPELQYIETKWASLMSYGMTVDLLTDVLPVNACLNAETIRRQVHKTAKRQDERLKDQPRFVSGCQNEWAHLPKPGKPLTVGIDGGYIRDCDNKKTNFEVIVAKSFSKTEAPKRLGFVQALDAMPQRRMMKLLRGQGMQENQQITFLSDGADNVRDLQFLMHPESEHILDWFHATMRLTVLKQFAKGLCHTDPDAGAELLKKLDRAKWHLWHGNVEKTLERLDDCYWLCENPELRYDKRRKNSPTPGRYDHLHWQQLAPDPQLWREVSLRRNHYHEVVAKRMVKKQQMQWSRHGAHCLLQTRTALLNGELRAHFEEWYL